MLCKLAYHCFLCFFFFKYFWNWPRRRKIEDICLSHQFCRPSVGWMLMGAQSSILKQSSTPVGHLLFCAFSLRSGKHACHISVLEESIGYVQSLGGRLIGPYKSLWAALSSIGEQGVKTRNLWHCCWHTCSLSHHHPLQRIHCCWSNPLTFHSSLSRSHYSTSCFFFG